MILSFCIDCYLLLWYVILIWICWLLSTFLGDLPNTFYIFWQLFYLLGSHGTLSSLRLCVGSFFSWAWSDWDCFLRLLFLYRILLSLLRWLVDNLYFFLWLFNLLLQSWNLWSIVLLFEFGLFSLSDRCLLFLLKLLCTRLPFSELLIIRFDFFVYFRVLLTFLWLLFRGCCLLLFVNLSTLLCWPSFLLLFYLLLLFNSLGALLSWFDFFLFFYLLYRFYFFLFFYLLRLFLDLSDFFSGFCFLLFLWLLLLLLSFCVLVGWLLFFTFLAFPSLILGKHLRVLRYLASICELLWPCQKCFAILSCNFKWLLILWLQ